MSKNLRNRSKISYNETHDSDSELSSSESSSESDDY